MAVFGGRRRDENPALPPGQYLTESFPVLSAGPTPSIDTEDWEFFIHFDNPKIEFKFNKTVERIDGHEKVAGVQLRDTLDGSETTLDLEALFIAIGADPRTHLVHGKLDFNPDGTIAVQGRSSRTSVPGVFAAGHVLDPTYRQAVTAAGSGTVAALDAEHYLASLPAAVLAQAVAAL